ncbi:MAG: guanylate kinase [Bacilli bacterium]|nr:guanylate kinase [Bacilli bacterium]
MRKKGKLFVISGPSGVGKDTIVKEYLKNHNGHLSVSATTRLPRKNEVDGKDYYFLTTNEFKNWIDDGNFLEYAIYNDNYYGTPKSKIDEYLQKGINVFLIIEVQGGLQIKNKIKNSVLIFILPPSLDELKQRLLDRNLDSIGIVENRLKIAEEEIKVSEKYDYLIVNRDVNNSVDKLDMIINEECK